MLNVWLSTAGAAKPAQGPDIGPEASDSPGLAVTIVRTPRPLNKVRLTQVIRDHGVRLKEARAITKRVSNGEVVTVVLPLAADRRGIIDAIEGAGAQGR